MTIEVSFCVITGAHNTHKPMVSISFESPADPISYFSLILNRKYGNNIRLIAQRNLI